MQRVLETARKFGLPVIVTDVAGRDPMVLMPLEQFEALTEGGVEPLPERHVAAPEVPVVESEVRVPFVAENEEFPQVSAEKPVSEGRKSNEPESVEMALEEQFFLEPVDDEGGL